MRWLCDYCKITAANVDNFDDSMFWVAMCKHLDFVITKKNTISNAEVNAHVRRSVEGVKFYTISALK